MKAGENSRLKIFGFFVLFIFIILGFLMSKTGLRGTDQYWYVEDTESLLNGQGVQSNIILSYNIKNDTIVNNRGFIHNVPPVYMAVAPGLLFGALDGWLVMNFLLTVLTSILLFLIAKKHFDYTLAYLLSFLYLVIPLTFWQSFQPLAEAFHALLLTSILYVYYFNRDIRRYFLIGLLTIILLLCRNNYVLIALIISIVFYSEMRTKYKIIYAGLYLISILGIFYVVKLLFPDLWNFSVYDTVITNKIGELNLANSGKLVGVYFKELIKFFREQFLVRDFTFIYYLPYNIFIFGTLLIWLLTKNRKMNVPVFLIVTAFGFHLITAVVFQNQARYLHPFYPAIMLGFFLQLKENYSDRKFFLMIPKFILPAIIVCLMINSGITYKAIQDGKSQANIRQTYTEIFKTIPGNESILYSSDDSTYSYIVHAYVLRPRNIFLLKERTYLKAANSRKLLEQQNIKWLITRNNLNNELTFPEYRLELKSEFWDYKSNSQAYLYKLNFNN